MVAFQEADSSRLTLAFLNAICTVALNFSVLGIFNNIKYHTAHTAGHTFVIISNGLFNRFI